MRNEGTKAQRILVIAQNHGGRTVLHLIKCVPKVHDVTRTPNDWMRRAASNERQLLGATAHGRCIFTFNSRDFVALSKKYTHHRGIILAAQSSWSLSALIDALDRTFIETGAEDWVGQVRWLNDWR